jgi:hypothetical protein
MIDHLLAAYVAWLLACGVPVWLGSFLYRSFRNTFRAYAEPDTAQKPVTAEVAVLPPLPSHSPTVHLPAAA